jgi:hypothetical protein
MKRLMALTLTCMGIAALSCTPARSQSPEVEGSALRGFGIPRVGASLPKFAPRALTRLPSGGRIMKPAASMPRSQALKSLRPAFSPARSPALSPHGPARSTMTPLKINRPSAKLSPHLPTKSTTARPTPGPQRSASPIRNQSVVAKGPSSVSGRSPGSAKHKGPNTKGTTGGTSKGPDVGNTKGASQVKGSGAGAAKGPNKGNGSDVSTRKGPNQGKGSNGSATQGANQGKGPNGSATNGPNGGNSNGGNPNGGNPNGGNPNGGNPNGGNPNGGNPNAGNANGGNPNGGNPNGRKGPGNGGGDGGGILDSLQNLLGSLFGGGGGMGDSGSGGGSDSSPEQISPAPSAYDATPPEVPQTFAAPVEAAPAPFEQLDEAAQQAVQQAIQRIKMTVVAKMSDIEEARADYQLVRGTSLAEAAIQFAARRFGLTPATVRWIFEMPETQWTVWKSRLISR